MTRILRIRSGVRWTGFQLSSRTKGAGILNNDCPLLTNLSSPCCLKVANGQVAAGIRMLQASGLIPQDVLWQDYRERVCIFACLFKPGAEQPELIAWRENAATSQ